MKNFIICSVAMAVTVALAPATPDSKSTGKPSSDWVTRVQNEIAEREYRASKSEEGLQAPNRAHGLRTYFEPTGIRVHDRTTPGASEMAALRLSGIGRGLRLEPVSPGEVENDGARVEIRRPGLVEWFENAPDGLEQGFTLEAQPGGSGLLQVELAVSPAKVRSVGESVVLETPAGRDLAYSKLLVVDASGTRLASHFESPSSDRLRMVIDDSNAVYPIVIDPILTGAVDASLFSTSSDSLFGYTVASAGDVNGDGYADVIVGAYQYNDPDEPPVRSGGAFIFHGTPTGIPTLGDFSAATRLRGSVPYQYFGLSVASAGDVNGDGYDDVIVGSTLTPEGSDEGAAFVFHGRPGGIPSGSAPNAILRGNQAGASLGYSVASAGDVDGDGYSDVIVGAPGYDHLIVNDPPPSSCPTRARPSFFAAGQRGLTAEARPWPRPTSTAITPATLLARRLPLLATSMQTDCRT
ncbi:MAG: FG-GAP repeat protein [Deltaproteobacteria bacterium]|nr:FG-GAP repeat protein [Deltaproteobacteria bacterium]